MLDRNKRIIVIGAGVIGAAIAHSLSSRNLPVTIIDKGVAGGGATSHSFAWINATAKRPSTYHDFNRRSLEMWNRFAASLDSDVGLRWGGQLEWASTPQKAEELTSRRLQLQAWGYPCQEIGAADIKAMEPDLNPGEVTGGIYSPLDGMVEPSKVAEACVAKATQNGALLKLDTEVTGLNMASGSNIVTSVETETESIPADVIVLAGGVDNTALAAMAGVRIPQQTSPGVVIRTEAISGDLLTTAAIVYAPSLEPGRPEIHFRQCLDGSVIIGEGSQESLARDDSQRHADELLSRAIHFAPRLQGTSAIPVPVGQRPMPMDELPVLGFSSKVPNVYIALTHSGVTLAPLIAELASIEIVEGTKVESLEQYRADRFSSSH